MNRPRISVLGLGYVGLCTAIGFAYNGFKVLASSNDAQKISRIEKGILPFYEPNLQEPLEKVLADGHLVCLLDHTSKAILETSITFVAVGTPSKADGSIDLQLIEKSSSQVGRALANKGEYHLVVIKSTVVPGTTDDIVKPILEKQSKKRCGSDFGLCMNPEFLREGSALKDILDPDRIVIGEHDRKSGDTLEELYRSFHARIMPPMIRTNLSTAEFIKYASNAFLATKISFINTIANICEKLPGVDVRAVAEGMGLDKRIGSLFLNAGLGYGGSCFSKDVRALIALSRDLGYQPKIFEAVENVNQTQHLKAVQLCKALLKGVKGKRIAILGLSFKPNTDDMREAKSILIIEQLLKEGADIIAYDPVAIPNAKNVFRSKIEYGVSAVDCLRNADCCILVTEWDDFKKLEPDDFICRMRQPILIDGRKIYDPKKFSRKLTFKTIGFEKQNLF